ncbi:MAG: DNA polymerase III subunit delta [Treponema sp.]
MASPIYLFTGPEIGERNIAVAKIKDTLTKQYGVLDLHNIYAGLTPISDVLSILQTGSLFNNAICVVLNNAHEITKKDEIQAIADWAKSSMSFPSFLILTSDEISINKSIETIVPKAQKQIFWELFENKKREWITRFFAKEKMKIAEDAIDSILELVENNTEMLKTSCSHLVLFFDEGKIVEAKDIETLLSHTKEETPFSLFDAISYLNFSQSLSIVQKLMQIKNTSPIQIIAGLTFCFRRLLDWHTIIRVNNGFSEMAVKTKGFTSKTAIEQYKRAGKNFSIEDTERILFLLDHIDFEMRLTGSSFQNILLEYLIYLIIAKRGVMANNYTPHPYKIF